MKKFPKPWYRPSRGVWFVTLDGKQHNLGPDEDEAFEQYKALLAKPQKRVVPSETVAVFVDRYLEWCKKNRAEETYRWYFDLLQAFILTIDPVLTVGEFKPFHVQTWVDSREDWSNGSRRNAIAAVKRVFRWAEEKGYIERSPIAHLKKPACGKKETIVPESHYKEMLALARDQGFRDLLTVTWETGCRPQESLRV
jgi:integrase